jgi:hypothetical protein
MVGPRGASEVNNLFDAYDYPHKLSVTPRHMIVPSKPFLSVTGWRTEAQLLAMLSEVSASYKLYETAEAVEGPLGFD